MPCEPPTEQLVRRLRQLLRADGADSCVPSTPPDRRLPGRPAPASPPGEVTPNLPGEVTPSPPGEVTIYSSSPPSDPPHCSRPTSHHTTAPMESSSRDQPTAASPPAGGAAPATRPESPGEPLAEAALARRFARRWWRQVSSRRSRRCLSAPEVEGDQERDEDWTMLESDGLGPGPEPVGMRRLQRPAALRQAVAAIKQRGRSAVCRMVAAGRQRSARRGSAAAVLPARPIQAVRCCRLLSPEPGLPLFESVSCDNLAGTDGGDGHSGRRRRHDQREPAPATAIR